MQELAEKYLRRNSLPFIFCPGCGDGQILNATIRAIDSLGIKDKIACTSGIGCSGWIPVYLDLDVMHTVHGRAIPVAEGLKLSAPEKDIIVFTGDGDCIGIGGNHFIHAARRNIDLTVVMVNNYIYGMTGGQKAPTTPLKAKTKTSPYGNEERPFDGVQLAIASGATYVARWSTYHIQQLENSIKKALLHEGFSFIEVLSQCPVQAGRNIFKEKDPWKMMQIFKNNTVLKGKEKKGDQSKIVIGEFVNKEEKEYSQYLADIRREINEN